MSTGISISSINQIKELAEEKRYAEALEVLDTQNLDKSINPQFLRISGEIFRKNKRYYDSRRILIKAHQMSPQGTRIISELIQLYLELGYFSLANQYYKEYKFYVGSEDTQKEFVEYIVKKANGADIKELASIVIPILERMPEDQWNYEAMLLYDKMDRKDKALDEARFILENYRNSIYVDRVISYIDDKLDVDAEFFVYPKEEQTEDEATYGDLILLEQSILKKDHLAMYPPEARIMVEVDDRDGFDAKPVKEKKEKKPKKKKIRKEKTSPEESETAKEENISDTTGPEADVKDEVASSEGQEVTSEADPVSESEAVLSSEEDKTTEQPESSPSESAKQTEEDVTKDETSDEPAEEKEPESDEEILQKQRNEALEKLLSKKIDTDTVKESAKQLADSIKGIDTAKAKSQVKMVTSTVVDNVKKASDALGDAVGTKPVMESVIQQDIDNKSEEIVDGIIEDVLEPSKQTVGQVVLNEELDALVPDSLEAMSTDEIADIEARKEEQERLELEALEAALKLEEEKRNKKFWSKNQETEEEPEESSYSKLKNLYMEEYMPKEEEIQSLGFVTVVHSDVDGNIETELPDTAQMLRQMIDNKEYYADENSLGFESEESYHNHGFEVEEYEKQEDLKSENPIFVKQPYNSDVYKVEDIYVDTSILSFDDMVPEVVIPIENYKQSDDWTHLSSDADEEKNMEETPEFEIETFEIETFEETLEETLEESLDSDFPESEEAVEEEDEIAVAIEETTVEEETDTKETEVEAAIVEETNAEKADVEVNSVVTESVEEITQEEETATEVDLLNPVEDIRRDRMSLRARIVITESMEQKLSVLKETK